MCSCGCGLPIDIAHGDEPVVIDSFRCNAGRALERHRRTEREKHQNAPEGWDDGLHYYARPFDPARDKRPPQRKER